jgi:hypothetical protein
MKRNGIDILCEDYIESVTIIEDNDNDNDSNNYNDNKFNAYNEEIMKIISRHTVLNSSKDIDTDTDIDIDINTDTSSNNNNDIKEKIA